MDYYEALGLEKGATESEIKKAYYKLARENHPDKVESSKREEATKRFQKIGEAYETLSDSEKRKIYDQFGKEGLTNNGQNNVNPFDIFSQMFGNQFGNNFGFNMQQQNQRNSKNKETIFSINISLSEVYNGLEKKLKVTRKIIMHKKEKLDVKIYEKSWKKCDKCQGQGFFLETRQIGPGMLSQSQKTCDLCSGKGHTLLPDYTLEETSEIITIIIEKGIQNGKKILFPNLGNASPGYLPGDLIVVVNATNQENGFIRDQNNLIYQKKIKLVDALCGTIFNIKTLDNRVLNISYNDVITPGEKRVIQKEGIAGGPLIIVFEIEFPATISSKQKLRKLLEI